MARRTATSAKKQIPDEDRPAVARSSRYSPSDRLGMFELIDSLSNFARDRKPLGPRDFRILCVVIIGELQQRPHDLSSVADAAGMARATAMRRVRALAERGLLDTERRGRRCVITASGALNQRLRPIVDKMIDLTLDFADGVRDRRE